MTLSFSRSVRFGLVRFNFNEQGIGVSMPIPGLGAGIEMRGAYISGGQGYFQYRRSISSPLKGAHPPVAPVQPRTDNQVIEDSNVRHMMEHEAKSILELQDSTSDALLKAMNEQLSMPSVWPYVGMGLLALLALLRWVTDWPVLMYLLIATLFSAVVGWLYWREQLSKLTILFYEPDQTCSELFDQLCSGLRRAASVQRLRSIATTSRYLDSKYSAGAGQAIQMGKAKLYLGHAPFVRANVRVPILESDRTVLAFYPDRILAFQGSAVGSIDYAKFSAESFTIRFIEDGQLLPADTAVIANTWRFVNKDGGPDMRFKDNHKLPICAYSQLIISTTDGLDIRLVGSKQGSFDGLVRGLANFGARAVVTPCTDDQRWGKGRDLVFRAVR